MTLSSTRSLQETFAPQGRCFGCGPTNDKGLRIRSFATEDSADAHVVCDFVPEKHHEAFENVLNGGIIGTVLDCHMNWTAIFHLMKKNGLDHAPCCVTADFKVVLKRPTPLGPVHVDAHVVSSSRRPRDDRGDDDGGRKGHGDRNRHVRRGEARPPRVLPLVALLSGRLASPRGIAEN